jgi:hypothetical protein
MQPASSTGGAPPGRANLKKWGPLAAIIVIVIVVVGVLVLGGGDDEASSNDTAAPVTQPTDATDAAPDGTDGGNAGGITYPLSFAQAEERGVVDQVDWGDRCDTERGRIAVPDFFAPDCYAPFEGDNGGATSRGVTADSIKVVVYQGPDNDPVINYVTDAVRVDDTNGEEAEVIGDMAAYFAKYYEFYGRSVDLEFFEGSGIATDEVAARADAVRIAEDLKPFVVIGGPALTSAFADELAARKVLCVSCTPAQPNDWYEERDPYVWGVDGSALQKQTHVLEFIEKQLVGKPAEHAGDEELQSTDRRFGLVYLESSQASADLADRFESGMADAGAPLASRIAYALDPATLQAQASQAIAKLKAAGVTTVILSGDPVAPRDLTREATAQGYFPEWVVAASTLMDTTAFARSYDQQQWAHAFGVTQLAARLEPRSSGYYSLYKWFIGKEPAAADSIGVYMPGPMLVHATLQVAGPDLTPESFRDALFQLRTNKAISQPWLTWGDAGIWDEPDYLGIDDATVFWWDAEATGPDEIRRDGAGMYRYVDGGLRYLPGEWPTDEKLFDLDGAIAVYETTPEGEERPEYPSPAG